LNISHTSEFTEVDKMTENKKAEKAEKITGEAGVSSDNVARQRNGLGLQA
jgi:hypothetical protein